MPRSGNTTERGYGVAHTAERQRWAPHVTAGHVPCHARRCLEAEDGRGRTIRPGTPWDLGHTPDRTAWTGPEHRRCNRSEGARRGNQARGQRRHKILRTWHSRDW